MKDYGRAFYMLVGAGLVGVVMFLGGLVPKVYTYWSERTRYHNSFLGKEVKIKATGERGILIDVPIWDCRDHGWRVRRSNGLCDRYIGQELELVEP